MVGGRCKIVCTIYQIVSAFNNLKDFLCLKLIEYMKFTNKTKIIIKKNGMEEVKFQIKGKTKITWYIEKVIKMVLEMTQRNEKKFQL